MDDRFLTLVGAVIAFFGCLSILLIWFEITIYYSYDVFHLSYTGISLLTADFGGFKLGQMTPLLISIAFVFMAARFLVVVKRTYLKDVSASAMLIIVASFYMIWFSTAEYKESGFIEIHNAGSGQIVALIIAFTEIMLAYYIDYTKKTSSSQPTAHKVRIECKKDESSSDGIESFVAFCPNCGHGKKEQDLNANYCKYCGAPNKLASNDSDNIKKE